MVVILGGDGRRTESGRVGGERRGGTGGGELFLVDDCKHVQTDRLLFFFLLGDGIQIQVHLDGRIPCIRAAVFMNRRLCSFHSEIARPHFDLQFIR